MADVDNSDFSRLASDLGKVSDASWRNMQTAIEVTARNVKDTWRDNAKGMPHAPAFPFSITYDVGVGWDQSVGQAVESVVSGSISSARGTTLRAEIGPDKGRAQGALGNLIDRLVYGRVADFFHFYGFGYDWYVFNVADIAIFFGAIAIIYEVLKPQPEA